MASKFEDDNDNLIHRLSSNSYGTDTGEVEQQPSEIVQTKTEAETKINSFQKTFKRFIGSITAPPGERKMTKAEINEIISTVTVGPLPQRFLVKFIGSRSCEGLWGSKVTRVPVDLMVRDLKNMDKADDLPLINVKIQEEGFKVSLHPKNRSMTKVKDLGLIPFQLVSYAVQDNRYAKIFVFILVREMSSNSRVTECHAYLCDSVVTCRKMALSVANAFRALEVKMKDKPYTSFQIDLKSVVNDITEI